MPRTRRLIPVDLAMHIMCRGNNKQSIFNRDVDKIHYYLLLCELKEDNKVGILHYCLMDNHLHLIIWVNMQTKLSRFMKQVNLSYFNYYKKTYSYFGHLWQGRFNSNIIDTDSYLLQCGKYIELNPVRAGIVKSPEEYRFTSYNYYAKGSPDPLITPSPAYLALSGLIEERRKQYTEFVVDRSIINTENLIKQLFIGSEAFIRKSQEYYMIKEMNRKRGRPRKLEK